MADTFRLSWDMPSPGYALADAAGIPDSEWRRIQRVGTSDDGILDQAATLARWAATGEEPIRDVVLERQVTQPTWVEVPL